MQPGLCSRRTEVAVGVLSEQEAACTAVRKVESQPGYFQAGLRMGLGR